MIWKLNYGTTAMGAGAIAIAAESEGGFSFDANPPVTLFALPQKADAVDHVFANRPSGRLGKPEPVSADLLLVTLDRESRKETDTVQTANTHTTGNELSSGAVDLVFGELGLAFL